MIIAENKERGLFAFSVSDGEHILQFARMRYDGKLSCFVNDSIINYCDFVTWWTKPAAIKAAKRLGFTADHIERIGSRYEKKWGLRYDIRTNYFLARYE
jgi:hypothetical protein